jgi:hypothetical protein
VTRLKNYCDEFLAKTKGERIRVRQPRSMDQQRAGLTAEQIAHYFIRMKAVLPTVDAVFISGEERERERERERETERDSWDGVMFLILFACASRL